MKFSISKFSEKKPSKLRCGDYVDYAVIESENLIVLALADGVGSTACDWKAAETTVNSFINNFSSNSKFDIADRFEISVNQTDSTVRSEQGACSGMSATLVAAIWDMKNKMIYYTSIGDSRIYAYNGDKLTQITHDDSKAVIMRKKDGKPYEAAGSVVIMEGITNAIGALKPFEIHKLTDAGIHGLVFMSDGVYNYLPNFETELINLFENIDLTDEHLKRMHTQTGSEQGDDFSVLMVRNNTTDYNFDINASTINIPKFHVAQAILKQLTEAIEKKESDKTLALTSFCKENSIKLGEKNIEKLIALMKSNDFLHGGTYQNLVTLLRTSK